MKTKKVLLIGGGTGGHIYPLRNLATELQKKGVLVEMVVDDNPLDKKIVKENFPDIKVYFLHTGKIRRYISLQNIVDIFKILKSCFAAKKILKETTPDILFFKGGYVGFPFLIAAKVMTKYTGKIFSHESDISEGFLTNKIRKYATAVFESFSPTTPLPLFYASESPKTTIEKDKSFPHILIAGGSQGSVFVNTLLLQVKDKLLSQYKITLITGTGKKINLSHDNFTQVETLPVQNIFEKIQEADLIISRAGATSLFEIISSKKPSIIIPLPSSARNHQMKNAEFFQNKNLCRILIQNEKAKDLLPSLIKEVLNNESMKKALQHSTIQNSAEAIAERMLE